MGSPNGDTPLADGNLLVSEINGSWVSEYTPAGKLVWTVQLPISYPSDPQQLGPDRYLIADYAWPGQILEFNREGTILYRYRAASGPGMLNHPSLTELLPSGVFMANDDYNHRMVAIDPATGALVWQYGITGKPGTAPGELNTPDGFDLLLPDGSTPTHPVTGLVPPARGPQPRRPGSTLCSASRPPREWVSLRRRERRVPELALDALAAVPGRELLSGSTPASTQRAGRPPRGVDATRSIRCVRSPALMALAASA